MRHLPSTTVMTGNYFAALPVIVADDFLEQLKRGAPATLRWLHPDDLHLTLAFFGREDVDRTPRILSLLDKITVPDVEFTLGSLHAFPRPKRFSALSFELDHGRNEITALMSQWRKPLSEAAGITPDSRPPHPHLTIARPARKNPVFHPETILQWTRDCHPPDRGIKLRSPVLYGWSDQRPRLQFRRIG